ncbi:AGAP007231-PA [Anopheles gambiae str. PEST]|uniref:AGAP007231-PA n=1 Tax=Anopheles gambiae TaxID=7165 RepID=A7URK1_ANOGA|nr:AGAP007231-PA [Anopheles gambiae str. PEST]
MKFAYALVLIALFAVIAISQALPEDAAAASNDAASPKTEGGDAAGQGGEAKGGRFFWDILKTIFG